jgi:YesN/AraC family two-component response regulator
MSETLDLVQLSNETKKLTALIVEDEKESNELMQNIFGKLFKKVYTAYDAMEGLQLYRTFKPDIVFTDIIMPETDGINFSKQIREIDKEQIIIIVSASNDMNQVTEAIQIGVNSFIQKPIEMKQLIDVLRQIVGMIGKRKKVETKVFSVNIPLDLYERLEEDAKDERISKTAVIVRALKQYYN